MKTLMMVIAVILLAVACGSDVTGPNVEVGTVDVEINASAKEESLGWLEYSVNGGEIVKLYKDSVNIQRIETTFKAHPGDSIWAKSAGSEGGTTEVDIYVNHAHEVGKTGCPNAEISYTIPIPE